MRLIPNTIRAGLTVTHPVRISGFPSTAWGARLVLRGPSAQNIDLQAQDDGSFLLVLEPAASTSWTAGAYAYSLRVTAAGTVHEVEAGTVEVEADLAAVDETHDPRSRAQRILDAVEARLESRATKDQLRYTINNRELWRIPLTELLQLRNQFKAEVARERARASGRAGLGRLIKPIL